jgi:tetratricopeptide (TPR) repeat protein
MDIHPEFASMRAEELTNLGREAILSAKYDLAFALLQAAIQKAPDSQRAYVLLQYLLELHGNYDAALEIHEEYKSKQK